MEPKKNDFEEKNKKQHNRNASIITFMIAAVSFASYIYTSSRAVRGPWWYPNNYASLALISLGLTFIATVISIIFFFEYKKREGVFIYKNVSDKVTTGIVIVLLLSLWHFIVGMKISIIEYVMFGIGIFLILSGIFHKSKK